MIFNYLSAAWFTGKAASVIGIVVVVAFLLGVVYLCVGAYNFEGTATTKKVTMSDGRVVECVIYDNGYSKRYGSSIDCP